MSKFEELLALADERKIKMARELVGREELVILLAQAAISQTTLRLNPKAVANLLGVKEWVTRRRIRENENASTKK